MPAFASAPGSFPMSSIAKLISFSVMPPRFINSPASIKNGIARRDKLPIPLKTDCGTAREASGVLVLTARTTRLTTPVISSEMYTGTPTRINTKVSAINSAIMVLILMTFHPPFRQDRNPPPDLPIPYF